MRVFLQSNAERHTLLNCGHVGESAHRGLRSFLKVFCHAPKHARVRSRALFTATSTISIARVATGKELCTCIERSLWTFSGHPIPATKKNAKKNPLRSGVEVDTCSVRVERFTRSSIYIARSPEWLDGLRKQLVLARALTHGHMHEDARTRIGKAVRNESYETEPLSQPPGDPRRPSLPRRIF